MSVRVSILATPDAMISPISGLFELLGYAGTMAAREGEAEAGTAPFYVEIVGASPDSIRSASGLPIAVHRAIEEVAATDVVIVPSMQMHDDGDWTSGRYPRLLAWIRAMYARGATVCSTCSGGLLTAETGLLDGHEATVHWISEPSFRRRHPEVRLRPDRTRRRGRRAAGLLRRLDGVARSRAVPDRAPRRPGDRARARARALHARAVASGRAGAVPGLRPADGPRRRGDRRGPAVDRRPRRRRQPGAADAGQSGLTARTFKRRFKAATGDPPGVYVQRLRVERAKRMLERGADSVEAISWAVGYEDSASFRRLFKRLAGCSAGEYRRRFRMPAVAG